MQINNIRIYQNNYSGLAPAADHISQRVKLFGPSCRELLLVDVTIGNCCMGFLGVNINLAKMYKYLVANTFREILIHKGCLLRRFVIKSIGIFCKVLVHAK